jgi:hypothetical protein
MAFLIFFHVFSCCIQFACTLQTIQAHAKLLNWDCHKMPSFSWRHSTELRIWSAIKYSRSYRREDILGYFWFLHCARWWSCSTFTELFHASLIPCSHHLLHPLSPWQKRQLWFIDQERGNHLEL